MSNNKYQCELNFENFFIRMRNPDCKGGNGQLNKSIFLELIEYLDDEHNNCRTVTNFEYSDKECKWYFDDLKILKNISTDKIFTMYEYTLAMFKLIEGVTKEIIFK